MLAMMQALPGGETVAMRMLSLEVRTCSSCMIFATPTGRAAKLRQCLGPTEVR